MDMILSTKKQAVELFGSQAELARALDISRQAIGVWPEKLTQRQIDEVIGAAIRLELITCGITAA